MKNLNLLLSAIFISVLALGCSGDKDAGKDDWNDKSRDLYMEKCMTALDEGVCECSLEKVEKKLKPSDMDKNDEKIVEVIKAAMMECMGV